MRLVFGFLLAAALAGAAPVPIPPREHPRLLLRASDLDALRAKTRHPAMGSAWARILADAKGSDLGAMRAAALVSLVEKDAAAARAAIAIATRILPAAKFDLSVQDISRQIGLHIYSAGLVYDWCHADLTEAEKALLIEHMERLAGMLECGYPPVRGGSITGHAGEAMILRDLLAGGIAIYDEKPFMYRTAAERIFAEHIPARNFFYPAGMHHQGNAYGPYRFQWEMYAAFLLRRMTGHDYFLIDQAQTPYRWIYARPPDGELLADGDMFRGKSPMAFLLAASYYHDPMLEGAYRQTVGTRGVDPIDEMLFHDPNLKPAGDSGLPLARFFGFPLSSTIARTAWNDGPEPPVIAEMKVNDYQFNNHHHLDAGSFQIWYRAPLAIDSGLYHGYGTDHDSNYLKRTIAHNAMLVYDPAEKFPGGRANDGGQRWPNEAREPRDLPTLLTGGYHVGAVLGQEIGENYAYLEGDLAQAYTTKVKAYRRGMVFLNFREKGRPAALIVYDRVSSSQHDFRKSWLLHAIGEPAVDGMATDIRRGGGRLVNRTLLPAEARIEKVGGRGREFWVDGKNHPPESMRKGDEPGAWRIEVTPATPAETDEFLNVMQVLDEGGPEPAVVEKIEAGPFVGVALRGYVVLFRRGDRLVNGEVKLPLGRSGAVRVLVTGLAPGRWTVERGGSTGKHRVGIGTGALYCEGEGDITLSVRP
jgi:heparin/heparan-sulfate lyase